MSGLQSSPILIHRHCSLRFGLRQITADSQSLYFLGELNQKEPRRGEAFFDLLANIL